MCGIAGAIGILSDQVLNAVAAMSASQAHRGPDGKGNWSIRTGMGRGVAFGHRRLAIIDLSEDASQPMYDEVTGCTLTYNGEVYNYKQLRAELQESGIEFSTESDTEVVLKAIATWGEQALGKFHGMYALAAWDPRRKRVLLARDRLGIKPLYYSSQMDTSSTEGAAPLLFASELCSLLESGLLARKLDPVSVETYLWNGFVPGPNSILQDVRVLSPGCYAWVDPEEPAVTPVRYWKMPQPVEPSSTPSTKELESALLHAVEERLVSDVPLGVFLSGGVDSSAVAALATKTLGRDRLKTFNIAFAEDKYDESPYALEVARQLGTEHERILLGVHRFLESLPQAIQGLDQPTFDAVNSYFVSRAVRDAGMTVALAGTGGDEMFGGYTSFVDIPRAQAWSRRVSCVPRAWLESIADSVARVKGGRFGSVKPQTRWGKLGAVLGTRGRPLDIYQISYSLFRPDFLAELQGGQSAHSSRAGLPLSRYEELAADLCPKISLQDISRLESSLFLGDRLLRDTDCTSMAVSLEVRLPLLDHKVIEAASRLPDKVRYHPLRRKQLLIQLGTPGLDPAIFARPKAGFELPFQVWLKNELREQVSDLLGDRDGCRSIGLERDAVWSLWSAFLQGAPGIYWSRIWALYILLSWTRQHEVTL